MSRSGYYDDGDGEMWPWIQWRGAVASAIRGQKGQTFFKEILASLDALPEKRLVQEALVTEDGSFCTLGAVGRARGLDMSGIDPEDYETVAGFFGVNPKIVQETVWMNDEAGLYKETPEQRFNRMRAWVVTQIGAKPRRKETA